MRINQAAPDFHEDAYINDEIRKIKLSDYRGKWVVLFFYPADFTFVCPTELSELAHYHETFKKMNTEIISVSRDTAFVHRAWHENSPMVRAVAFPMLADPTAKVCRDYGTYIEEEGLSFRATFLINPEGIVKAFEINDNSIGRSIEELIRKLQAAQYVAKHDGEVCPMNWKPGAKTLKPGVQLIGKL